ncbi:carboxymuconolactone decarboxylase family protein [Streptomyces sp. NPDC050149]|uniref:carboxymuconolactone decarboxylase family protein n=1 Tax=unclassified Streptomyces TaxID=2593676 RepID=UPI002E303919|nr:carboxymuconolactone decarboxylase family protein [Streptomyces sp. NBC_01358]
MYSEDWQQAARAVRREVVGNDGATTDPLAPEGYQDYVTAMAWGVWAREGALSNRDRSLLVLAMTATAGRTGAFRVHLEAAPRAGVSDAEIDALLFQITAYCGAPAGNEALAVLREVRNARETA